ncbi:MAG: hypothetical protein ACKVZH_02025 [Blastocatellia bacterium]
MATSQLELIFTQIKPLKFEDKLQLLQWVAEDLKPTVSTIESTGLVYGKYKNTPGRRMSTEEDFKIAEWNPTEAQLNGE